MTMLGYQAFMIGVGFTIDTKVEPDYDTVEAVVQDLDLDEKTSTALALASARPYDTFPEEIAEQLGDGVGHYYSIIEGEHPGVFFTDIPGTTLRYLVLTAQSKDIGPEEAWPDLHTFIEAHKWFNGLAEITGFVSIGIPDLAVQAKYAVA